MSGVSKKKLAIGTLIAGAAGYVAGILTAPKSGKETREDIKDKAGDIKEGAQAQLENLQGELNDLLNKAKTKSVALGSKARGEYNEAVVNAKDAKDKMGHLIRAVRAGEAEDPQLARALKQAQLAKKNLGKYFKR